LATSLKEISELKSENSQNEQSRKVFDLATKLEGTIRSHGVHAAGVVIAPDDIVNYTPLEMAQKGVISTQYSMWPIEDLGLLKMDFLGLSNLTTINNALRIIRKVYGEDIDISQIPMDDKKTFELLKRGDTVGVFQLESAGMRRYLKQLKPTVFDDIISMVALYRPGPMQWIDDFIARKHGLRKIEYLHTAMKPALESTYGVIVTQEQVMQISIEMCGFTGGQADTLRKAIGKKIPEVMKKLKNEFIEGGIKTVGADRKLMEKFWVQLEDFAAYCFNKAHSACYGLIAYQTAYLKAHYPDAFMAALMTSDYDNTDRLAIEITECKHMGIEVLAPDINESYHEFGVVPGENKIRFGLDAIKNVGHGAAEEILRARKAAGGRIESLDQYCEVVNCRTVNRKSLESLIKAGAFDSFGERSLLLNSTDNILSLSQKLQKDSASGQVDLFGDSPKSSMAPRLSLDKGGPEHTLAEQLSWERELLGLYLSHNPLESYSRILDKVARPIVSITKENDGQIVTVGGSLAQVREISTKNGSKMAFARLADSSGDLELIVFPKTYASSLNLWQRDNIILAKGKVDFSRNDEPKILVEEAKALDSEGVGGFQSAAGGAVSDVSLSEAIKQRLYIRLEDTSNQSLLVTLKEKLDGHHGDTEVVLVTGTQKQIIRLPQTVSVNEESLRELAGLFGSMNVVVR
ncbi:DNA polymerase III subunit alpha, partial [Candidatus Saccharibacteria bacterium]|nr:DNA polymerase III subunit alpha [Candidatus Saccharibacteria bacterium]